MEDPDYFTGFNKELQESSKYLEAWRKFIEDKHALRDPEDATRIFTVEALLLDQLGGEEGFTHTVELFELHWQIRDHQREAFIFNKDNPQEGDLYLLWDFKETTPESPIFVFPRIHVCC